MQRLPKASYLLWSFFIIYAFLWVLTPSLVRFVTPMDSTEGAMWGQVLQWGYPRDPWFNALLTKFALWVSGDQDWSVYLLSQLMVLLAIWSVWRLGRIILKNDYLALVAVIILVAIQYYNLGVVDFNDNACELGLWPLMFLYFYRSLTTNRLKHWLYLGVIAGVGMMAKYYTAVPLVTMFLFMLFDKSNHCFFKEYKIYLALIIVFAISTPHAIWLFVYDFVPIQFSLSVLHRSADTASLFTKHFGYGIDFFFAQIGTFMGAVAVFLFGYFGKVKNNKLNDKPVISQYDHRFLFYVGIAPFLLTVLISMTTGWRIYTMWGIPLLSMWGVILLAWTKPVLTKAKVYRVMFVAGLVTVLLITGYSISLSRSKTSSANYPARAIAKIMTESWHERYHTPLRYVAGYNRPVSYMARYSQDRPEGLIDFNPALNPALNMKDLREKGAVFILIPQMEGHNHFSKEILNEYPNLIITPFQEVKWERAKPDQKPMRFQIAYLPPAHLTK
ncbi:glycosyltransferase family 39 protein [Fangia hongkongensis]|uniref:glycosyltransferase family 39 protein n=2 Tax=Fangia hongkongensis TaxID=270495 RepID=UPI00037A5C5D|nr:glycosyltransferase family 39 protein [Fangia hongkongensis]